MTTNTPAGWFPDQSNNEWLRWWDGHAWTEHTRPRNLPGSPPVGAPAAGCAVPALPPMARTSGRTKPWYLRWWAITAAALVTLTIVGSLLPDEEPTSAAATEPSAPAAAPPSDSVEGDEAEPEPSDTDNDGVNDDEDFRPNDPKVQTQQDIDTDKDGVADFEDDFPRNAKYSKDTDGDGVADPLDDFPKDARYSQDTDGDRVADSEDAFPADPGRSKITTAMENAIAAAASYLDYTAFSRSGLIGQLEFEGYETADATFAVDYLEVDWNEQAVKSARAYLGYTSFSLQGLVEQLQFEGFTYEQAAYGANKAYR